MLNHLKYYTLSFLQNLQSYELLRLAANSFEYQEKNYKLLTQILQITKDYECNYIVECAIEALEIKAIEIVLNNKTFDTLTINNFFKKLWKTITHIGEVNLGICNTIPNDQIKKKAVFIAELLFQQNNATITEKNLDEYASYASKDEFYNFIERYDINISLMNLELLHYRILDQKPIFVTNSLYNSPEEVLLSHTYSTSMSLEEIKQIYTTLLRNTNIEVKDIMYFAVTKLINGNNLKIIFEPYLVSSYEPLQNIIRIGDVSSININMESTVIHELGHYVFDKLFYCSANPFKLNLGNQFDNIDNTLNSLYLKKTQGEFIEKLRFGELFKAIDCDMKKIFKYDDAVTKLMMKIGELLGVQDEIAEYYPFSQNIAKVLIDISTINLFHDHYLFQSSQLGINELELPVNEKAAYYYAFLQADVDGNDVCLNQQNKFHTSFKDIITFVKIKYVPYLINKLSLTNDQIHFLHRMNDLIEYGNKDILRFYAEAVVRLPEFQVANVSKDIIDTFAGIAEYWKEEVSPIIKLEINAIIKNQTISVDSEYLNPYAVAVNELEVFINS